METLREILDPHFLLRNSVYVSLLIGFACPLVGVYLILRRLIFMGVALPQISSAGIAFAFSLPAWGLMNHMHFAHFAGDERLLAFVGGLGFTLLALLGLAFLERRGRGLVEGRIGTLYALAGAWAILLLVKNPMGERGLLDLLRGEIIAVPDVELWLTAAAFAIVVGSLFLFKKEFLLVSFDRDMAVTLKKNVLFWDAFLFLLIGLAISIAVLSVGPLVTFGFLLLPPLIAHLFARNMRQFSVIASGVGGLTALAGFCLAYRLDYPVGPTDVALLGGLYMVAVLAKKSFEALRRSQKTTKV
ncbi:MAG TPA: metal ABC transporter permease [Candidatus Sulfotelmatobacter sp.]|nr:metal ABC transporter permease [Candidatus Sulfotelmatobacter sp.]HWI56974.1 metal ABC transporter permease [Bacillota bacterium]